MQNAQCLYFPIESVLVRALTRALIRALTRDLTRALTRALIRALIRTLSRALSYALSYACAHARSHTLFHTCLHTRALTHALHTIACALIVCSGTLDSIRICIHILQSAGVLYIEQSSHAKFIRGSGHGPALKHKSGQVAIREPRILNREYRLKVDSNNNSTPESSECFARMAAMCVGSS